jgi:hypothetical protein
MLGSEIYKNMYMLQKMLISSLNVSIVVQTRPTAAAPNNPPTGTWSATSCPFKYAVTAIEVVAVVPEAIVPEVTLLACEFKGKGWSM